MKTCPFCAPGIAEIAFVQSTHFYAIYNRSPVLPGHSMIIPKKHYKSLLDLPAGWRAELMELSVKAVKMLQKTFQAGDFNWTLQDGIAAGQTIMHLHLHLIPRYPGDLPNPGDWYPLLEKQYAGENIDSANRPQYSWQQLKTIAGKISKHDI